MTENILKNVAMLGFGDPETQWGGTNAVTKDIIICEKEMGIQPLYIYGTGSYSGPLLRKTKYGYEIGARRFFLNTNDCFYNGQDDQIIELLLYLCLKHDIHIMHIQDYCGWPYGLIERLEANMIKVIVKIGNAWSLCPRLTLFSTEGRNCATNYQLDGCAKCVSSFRSANAQKHIMRIKDVLRTLGLINWAQTLYSSFASKRTNSSIPRDPHFFISRREAYLSDLGKASIIHFSSLMSLNIYQEHGLKSHNSRVLNPSISIDKQLCDTPPVSDHFRRFGYIGGLSRLKGVDVLIKAFRALTYQDNPVELRIWGEGDRSLISSLPHNVYYMGRYDRSMLPDIMAEIDCGILPSSCPDVHPIVSLEYAAAKRPVIMSSSCGTATMASNIYPELVFESGSCCDLRSKVQYTLSHWSTIKGKSARIPQPKKINNVVAEYLALYRELTSEA